MSVGIKETKEAIVGMMLLGALIAKKTKDGLQFADLGALFAEYQSNPEFKKAMDEAYKDIGQVGAEVKDLDFKESMELGALLIAEVPKLVEALK